MNIEIDILNGKASWPAAKPLLEMVWPSDTPTKLLQGHARQPDADLRVLIETESQELVCHVGIYFRNITWNGRKLHVGGIGSVATHPEYRRRGFASVAIEAAIQSMRDREDVQFALIFCEPDSSAFYETRGWHLFAGEVRTEQESGLTALETMTTLVFDLKRGPRQGIIDLGGIAW